MNKYTVTPHQESSVYVEADRMELVDKQVTLFVGAAIKAHFPHIESVVVSFGEAPPSAGASHPVDGFGLTLGEAVSFEVPPRIEIGVLNITTGSTDLNVMLDEVRAQLPKTKRGECLNAVLHYVGELVYRRGGSTPEADIDVLHGLKTAVVRMQHVVKTISTNSRL